MKRFDNASCWWMCRLEHLYGGQFGNTYKKLQMSILFDVAIPLLEIYHTNCNM